MYHMRMMINFPNHIATLLKTGFTEDEIAERIGVSQPTVNRIKKGTQIPRHDVGELILKLCSRFVKR